MKNIARILLVADAIASTTIPSAPAPALTVADVEATVNDLNALIDTLTPHFKQGAHLITAVGTIRTTIENLNNHIAALKAKAVVAAAAVPKVETAPAPATAPAETPAA